MSQLHQKTTNRESVTHGGGRTFFRLLLDKPWWEVSSLLPPRLLPSMLTAHRVQRSHGSSIFIWVLLAQAFALSAGHLCTRRCVSDLFPTFLLACGRLSSSSEKPRVSPKTFGSKSCFRVTSRGHKRSVRLRQGMPWTWCFGWSCWHWPPHVSSSEKIFWAPHS